MARRYLISKSRNNAINIITVIAGIGVFAGALALFIVLSGFSGLKAFSIQFTNDIDPDLKVLPVSGKVIMIDSTKLKKLDNLIDIQGYSKVVEERVLLSYDNRNTPATIKGVDDNYNKVTATNKAVIAGQWFDQNENHVIIGSGISRKLSLGILGYNDVLKLLVPKPGKGIITDPRKAFSAVNTVVVGIYDVNEDLNSKYVFAPLPLSKKLLGLKADELSSIALKLAPGAKEKEVKKEIKAIFGDNVLVKNRIELNDELYKMLNTENLAVYFIFTLVLIIALFNVGGAIVMAILDKRDNIKTLFSIGAQARKIKQIFFLQGALLTFVGGIIGLGVGVIAVILQLHYGFVMITSTLPYPVRLKAQNVAIVFVTIMVLGLMASYIATTRVSKALK